MTVEQYPRYVRMYVHTHVRTYACVIQMYACLITETQHGMRKD